MVQLAVVLICALLAIGVAECIFLHNKKKIVAATECISPSEVQVLKRAEDVRKRLFSLDVNELELQLKRGMPNVN